MSASDDPDRRPPAPKHSWRAYAAPLLFVVAAVAASLYYVSQPEPPPSQAALAAAGATDGKPAERTAALPPVSLPADDAVHRANMEWWYYSGILDAAGGRRYAFHVAVFVANGLVKHTAMHAALTDLRSGKRHATQTRTGGLTAKNVANGFDFGQQDWQVAALDGAHKVRAVVEGASFDIGLKETGPLMLHRAAGSQTPGLIDFGSSGISYYYSRPRLEARGEITIDGARVPVSGKVWFDHQWGDFDVLTLGWNWFALHLADGSDVMLYELFDAKGQKTLTAGTLTTASGSVPLAPGEVELTPVKTWTSPRTRISYNVGWKIRLPAGEVEVRPFFADGEFDSSATTANVYWEGPVRVTGSTTGEGFLELSGYDRLAAQAGRK